MKEMLKMTNFPKQVRVVIAGVLMTGLCVSSALVAAQRPQANSDPQSISGPTDTTTHNWTTDQLLTSTVHEAWVLSGRNEDQFFDMVQTLAALSAQKRGLTMPDDQAAGAKAGTWIKKEAKRDPDQLLYAVVDKAVMKVGTKTAMAAK